MPDFYFRFLYGFSANWQFVLIANTQSDPFDQIARVHGEIFVFDRDDWERLVEVSADDVRSPKDVFERDILAWARCQRGQVSDDQFPEESINFIRNISLFSYEVALRRSGVIWLTLNYVAANIRFSHEYSEGMHLPFPEDIKYIANQCFFFMKDISHNHRHHPPGSDTITEVAEIDKRKTWAIETYYRIHRKIVEMRRSEDPKIMYNALGVLAYLNALGKSTDRVSGRAPHRGPLSYNNSEIEASIKSSLEVMRWKQVQKNIIKTALPTLLIAAISFTGFEVGSLGYLARGVVNNFFANHPRQSTATLAMIAFSVPFYYGLFDFHSLPPILRAKRILVNVPISLHAVFWLLGAAWLFAVSAGELLFASILSFPWAASMRGNPRFWSWLIVLLGVFPALSALYLLPFVATWRALVKAISNRIGALKRDVRS